MVHIKVPMTQPIKLGGYSENIGGKENRYF